MAEPKSATSHASAAPPTGVEGASKAPPGPRIETRIAKLLTAPGGCDLGYADQNGVWVPLPVSAVWGGRSVEAGQFIVIGGYDGVRAVQVTCRPEPMTPA